MWRRRPQRRLARVQSAIAAGGQRRHTYNCRRTLEHFGANVTATASADEALRLAETMVFDLVLTDIAMPERDGYWLLAQLRKHHPRVRIAAITAVGASDAQIASAGFDSYIRKPIDPVRLAEILAQPANL